MKNLTIHYWNFWILIVHVLYLTNVMFITKQSIPQITERICIVFDLHVNQFYKASPKTFPDRFRKFRSKDMLPNSPAYIRIESEQWGDALDKL